MIKFDRYSEDLFLRLVELIRKWERKIFKVYLRFSVGDGYMLEEWKG